MAFPVTVQVLSELESEKKFGLLAVNEQVAPAGRVLFRDAATVTQVPGVPAAGIRVMLLILKSVAAA